MPWNKDRIIDLLSEAGAIALRTKKDLGCEVKADRSIVTRADREIEGFLSRELERPEKGAYLIGEETIAAKGEEYIEKALQEECYVVDPIDGTAPYAHQLPNWGVSIGRMQGSVLTDGAVYLPELGEMVLNDGSTVLQGSRAGSQWTWSELEPRGRPVDSYGLLAVTQGIAKRGKVSLPNPVMVLGVAVVPLVGMLQGRFTGYLGSVKLWDIAGVLPLLLMKGFSVTVFPRGERRVVTNRVEEHTYHLRPESQRRWGLRSDLLVCRPEDELRFRSGFTEGEKFGGED
jgi:fructose-1,6-bisphosphatase/inositol monophosphatase family enzyme